MTTMMKASLQVSVDLMAPIWMTLMLKTNRLMMMNLEEFIKMLGKLINLYCKRNSQASTQEIRKNQVHHAWFVSDNTWNKCFKRWARQEIWTTIKGKCWKGMEVAWVPCKWSRKRLPTWSENSTVANVFKKLTFAVPVWAIFKHAAIFRLWRAT